MKSQRTTLEKAISSHRELKSPRKLKRQKRESQVPKIPKKTLKKTIKENAKCQKVITQNIQEIQDTMRPNLRIIGIEESENQQFKGPVNIFNKIVEENFPNLKKEIHINIQEAYRTPDRLDQKRNSSRHIIKHQMY